ncbi:chromosome segregation protein SMC, partial [Streptomyces sp. SID9727]|nr:chromosome segregation protein SMC [Streptomyces sp. SID9727]
VAAALGAAADAVAVTDPATAAEAIRLLRKQDAGRAALLLGGVRRAGDGAPEPVVPAGTPAVADLVSGPVELVAAVRRLVRDMVVVATLEDAEDLVAAHPELTAVTGEGDLLSAHFAHGGSAGAPSLLEVQASVDEAAAELDGLAVRCTGLAEAQRLAAARRTESAALVEELGERRRAAERERSGVAQQLGRLAGQARGAAGEAERMDASAT